MKTMGVTMYHCAVLRICWKQHTQQQPSEQGSGGWTSRNGFAGVVPETVQIVQACSTDPRHRAREKWTLKQVKQKEAVAKTHLLVVDFEMTKDK